MSTDGPVALSALCSWLSDTRCDGNPCGSWNLNTGTFGGGVAIFVLVGFGECVEDPPPGCAPFIVAV